MKNRFKLCAALILNIIFIISAVSLLAFADAPRTIHLDLSQPPQQYESKDDPFTEKYKEVMEEIVISEEAALVVNQIKLAAEDVNDLSMDVQISEIRGHRNEVVVFHILGSVEHKAARVEFRQPSHFRGLIMVADQEKMELRTFQPVVNMITVQTLEDASKEALSALNIAQITTELTSYFDFTQYHVEVLEVVKEEGLTNYLLEVDAPDDQIWQVWVKDDNWIPHEIVVYEEEVLLGHLRLSNLSINPEVSLEEITELPKVKEERI